MYDKIHYKLKNKERKKERKKEDAHTQKKKRLFEITIYSENANMSPFYHKFQLVHSGQNRIKYTQTMGICQVTSDWTA